MTFGLLIAAGLSALAAQPASPPAGGPGSNPIILDRLTADPAALVVGDRVYLYVGRDLLP